MQDRKSVHENMCRVLREFMPVLKSWTVGKEQKMKEPFETEYSENYAPANAAVIYASVYRNHKAAEDLDSLRIMIARSVTLLKDKEVSPFCRVFIFHYSMMALLILPALERLAFAERYKDFYARYEDDCKQINTNCAALQWGIELFVDALGCRPVDETYLNELLDFVEHGQNEYGFINDEIDPQKTKQDGMPIAYHAFTLFILTGAIAVIENWKPTLISQKTRAEAIIAKGLEWLKHAVSFDGFFAMVERSSYQMFTWGTFVALYSYSGMQMEGFLNRAFENWLPYQHKDGTYGVTPNHLPHELRTGYEGYSHVNMYNNLGLTGIAVAVRILERDITMDSSKVSADLPQNSQFIDVQSGYAFIRRGFDFFGCTLRMHNRKYVPAMQAFHVRLADCRLPLAEAKFEGYRQKDQRFLSEGVWEGYLLTDNEGHKHFPDMTENVQVITTRDGIEMETENEFLYCKKLIALLCNGIEWNYTIKPKRDFLSCEQVLPILLHDGKEGSQVIEKSAQMLHIHYGERKFALSCSASKQIGTSLHRSLLSVSGVSTKAHLKIEGFCNVGAELRWSTRLELI
ncbi:hypothetical protein O9H85_00160 [Paenibacillus filicis]|uniref:Uncharacterized protein n=1 Tax=Paenibacillus gyeongsangnamensis TaxID=3388067 RepID=A0ABT4Q280_9BACL|nr:hypothetical protein [Paenibacillus filicis]MCZ8510877.1 hypothetical protein [Paenibacillus filicis]